MSSKQSSASKRRRADAPSRLNSGGTEVDDLHVVMAEMKSQLESLQQWKLSAEERLLRLEAQNERLGKRLEEDRIRDGVDTMTSISSVARVAKARHDKLQQQCAFLDRKCTALEETLIEDVLRDPDWRYTEPYPNIDFEELGYENDDNPYIDIRNAVLSLRSERLELLRETDIEVGNISDPVLVNNDEMAPHWRQLADAIRLRYPMGQTDADRSLCCNTISFMNVKLPRYMAKALALKNFGKLTLSNNHFDPVWKGYQFILDVLMKSASLRELVWDRNEISDERFGRVIENHNVLTSITISRSCTDSATGTSLFRSILNVSLCNTDLTKIYMDSNYIEIGGEAFLSDHITKNTPLRCLSLMGNRLNDHDALQIAQALKKNCNLMELNLENNLITNGGYSAIRRAIWAEDLTFNELYHCNHVCVFKPRAAEDKNFYADKHFLRNNSMSRAAGVKARAKDNLSAKVIYAFKNKISTNSLVSSLQTEFGNASLKLTPYILKAIHHYYTTHPVSISFEKRVLDTFIGVLRVWMVPEMYDRSCVE